MATEAVRIEFLTQSESDCSSDQCSISNKGNLIDRKLISFITLATSKQIVRYKYSQESADDDDKEFHNYEFPAPGFDFELLREYDSDVSKYSSLTHVS